MDDADQLEQSLRDIAQSVSFVVGELFRPQQVKIERDNWSRVLRGEFARISPVREHAARLVERHRHALRSKRTEFVSCGRGLVAASYSELIILASETLSKWLEKFLTNNEQKKRPFSEWERIWGELGFDAMTSRFPKWVDLGIESNMLIELSCIGGHAKKDSEVNPPNETPEAKQDIGVTSANERELGIKSWHGVQDRFHQIINNGSEIDATIFHMNANLEDPVFTEVMEYQNRIKKELPHPQNWCFAGYGPMGIDDEKPWKRLCFLHTVADAPVLESFRQTGDDAARLLNQLPESVAQFLWAEHPKLPAYGCEGYPFWSDAVLHLAMREIPGSPLSNAAECHTTSPNNNWWMHLGWHNWMLLESDPTEKNKRLSQFSPSYQEPIRWWHATLPAFVAKSCQAIDWILLALSMEPQPTPVVDLQNSESPARADEATRNGKANVKPKRSTQKGDGEAKCISTLTEHHQYADGSSLNQEPIGSNELARKAGVGTGTASRFFDKNFGGHEKYVIACRDVTNLVASLKMLNKEYAPRHLLGGSLPHERDE